MVFFQSSTQASFRFSNVPVFTAPTGFVSFSFRYSGFVSFSFRYFVSLLRLRFVSPMYLCSQSMKIHVGVMVNPEK